MSHSTDVAMEMVTVSRGVNTWLQLTCPSLAKDTLLIMYFLFPDATKKTDTHRNRLSTRHSAVTMCI